MLYKHINTMACLVLQLIVGLLRDLNFYLFGELKTLKVLYFQISHYQNQVDCDIEINILLNI